MGKSPRFGIRMTADELAVWAAAAKAEGLTLSAWIRTLVDSRLAGRSALRPSEIEAINNFTFQIRKIGTNLNGLVFVANKERFLDDAQCREVETLRQDLQNLVRQVETLLAGVPTSSPGKS